MANSEAEWRIIGLNNEDKFLIVK